MYFEEIVSIDIKTLLIAEQKIYAHRKEHNSYELLEDHAALCLKYFHLLVKEKNLENIFIKFEQMFFPSCASDLRYLFRKMLLNLFPLHDLGKVAVAFQKIKMENDLGISLGGNNDTNHSMLGSYLYLDLFLDQVEALQ